jgi:hypothetical protein
MHAGVQNNKKACQHSSTRKVPNKLHNHCIRSPTSTLKHMNTPEDHGVNQSRGKAIPITGHGGPQGCETVWVPHYLTIGSEMAVRLSALRVSHLLPPRKISGTHFS